MSNEAHLRRRLRRLPLAEQEGRTAAARRQLARIRTIRQYESRTAAFREQLAAVGLHEPETLVPDSAEFGPVTSGSAGVRIASDDHDNRVTFVASWPEYGTEITKVVTGSGAVIFVVVSRDEDGDRVKAVAPGRSSLAWYLPEVCPWLDARALRTIQRA